MRNLRKFSPVKFCTGAVGALLVTYIGLIAVVMSYASISIEYTQSIKHDESDVATLEAKYMAEIGAVTTTDYRSLGYAAPSATTYVSTKSVTALR